MSQHDSKRLAASADQEPRQVDRYVLFGEIASGGMASVHIARLTGAIGFSRTVAIKRMLPRLGDDPESLAMFRDEARIAARIHHPNVVSILDVVADGDELFLVMDYIEGESLGNLLKATSNRGALAPREIVLSVMYGTLQGLHAAHEARNELGELLHVVHRDVSPQNILVGVDGMPRVLDFGIATAVGRLTRTQVGHVKGKFGYMAPEQLVGGEITRRTDVYAASVVLWEALTGARLFVGDDDEMAQRVVDGVVPNPREVEPGIPRALARIVMKGLAQDPAQRYPTALDMAEALSDLGWLASPPDVGEWAAAMAAGTLAERAALLAAIESGGRGAAPAPRSARPELPSGAQTASATLHPAPEPRKVPATDHAATGEETLTETVPLGRPARSHASASGIALSLANALRRAPPDLLAAAGTVLFALVVVIMLLALALHHSSRAKAAGSASAPTTSAPSAARGPRSGAPPDNSAVTPR